jgi:hypothetical protein
MKMYVASIVIALTCVSTLSLANNPSSSPETGNASVQAAVVVRPEALKLDVLVGPNPNAAVMVHFMDERGSTLATRRLSKRDNPTRVRFDLSELADGQYTVRITDGSMIKTRQVELNTQFPTPSMYRTVSLQ